MMKYIYEGNNLDYKNATENAIAAGSVISLVSRIGIAGTDIPAGATGSICMTGVFELPKKTASAVIPMGTLLYWDGTAIVTTASENIPAGYAAAPSANGDTYIQVKLLG